MLFASLPQRLLSRSAVLVYYSLTVPCHQLIVLGLRNGTGLAIVGTSVLLGSG